jgi:hypothetical protein
MIFGAVLPCNARTAQPAEPSIKLRLMGGRPVVDDVYINDQGPFRFLLDTGAASNQLNAALAPKLGLKASFQVELATAAGTTHVKGSRTAKVALGAAAASGQEFLFTTLDGVHSLSSSIQGVLGEEFLSRFDYVLDFHNHRLAFGTASPEGPRIPFHMVQGIPVIQTSEGELALDSGTDAAVLWRAFPAEATSKVRTASGFVAVSTANIRLRIGDREIHRVEAAFAPRSAIETEGLLPASLFKAVYFSNSEKFVILDPAVR